LGGKQFYDALTNTQGIRDLPPHIEKALVPYALRDNDLCYAISSRSCRPSIPAQEWATIDWCAKCAVRPTLALDSAMLWEAHHEEVERKKARSSPRVGIGDYEGGQVSTFNSNDKFAALLKPLLDAYGEDLPMKASKGKNVRRQADLRLLGLGRGVRLPAGAPGRQGRRAGRGPARGQGQHRRDEDEAHGRGG
jgi:hypothetical protein